MPSGAFKAYVSMLPVLKAQESLRRYDEFLFSAGRISKASAATVKGIIKSWQRDANTYAAKPVRTGQEASKDLEMRTAMMGIPIVKKKKEKNAKV